MFRFAQNLHEAGIAEKFALDITPLFRGADGARKPAEAYAWIGEVP
jgi:hypothetical protein